jgi:hypothetical protein
MLLRHSTLCKLDHFRRSQSAGITRQLSLGHYEWHRTTIASMQSISGLLRVGMVYSYRRRNICDEESESICSRFTGLSFAAMKARGDFVRILVTQASIAALSV